MATTPIEHPGLLVQWGVGILVVLLYARDRFDSPGPVRWTTTFGQYWFARTGYMGVLILGYLILAGAFTDAKPLLDFLVGQDSSIRSSSEYLPGPLFAALLLTSFLPHIPQLQKLDEAAKRLFQRIGNIPHEMRVFSAQLERARLVPGSRIRKSEYIQLGVKTDWLQLPESRLTYWWARIGLMHAAVNEWDGDPRYIDYVTERKMSRDDINRRVEQFLALDAVGPNGVVADELAPGTPAYRHASREIEDIHRSLCDFIAGGLLHGARGARQRQTLLNELGFEAIEKELRSAMSIHHVILIGGIIFLMVLFAALIFEQFVNPGDLRLEVRVLFMIPILYCTSIMIAIYSKSTWSFADIRQVGSRPVGGYFAAAAVAVAAAFVIQLLFRFVQGGNVLQILSESGNFRAALATNIERWPWYVMTFFTTVAIAWAADNYYSSDKIPSWLRAAETAGMAVFFGGLQWVTLALLIEFSPNPERWFGKEWQMIVTTTLVGACIGFFVPHFYRRSFKPPEPVRPHPLTVLAQAV